MSEYGTGYAKNAGVLGQTTASIGATDERQELRSESIIKRLNNIRSAVIELSASVDSAAEKIVGPKPQPLNLTDGLKQTTDRPQPSCFLEAVIRILSDLERCVEADLRLNVNRLHREF